MKNFVFVSIVLLSFAFPAQSQDAPVMQKTASGDEIHIDFIRPIRAVLRFS